MALNGLALLEAARTAVISVTAEGDQLRIRGPRSAGGIMQQLREHEAEILALVRLPDAVDAQSAPLSHTPDSSQAPDIAAHVFMTAKSIGFPRVRLPDGRICKDEDRWRMVTSSKNTTQADLAAVLACLVALGGACDSPDRVLEGDEATQPAHVTPATDPDILHLSNTIRAKAAANDWPGMHGPDGRYAKGQDQWETLIRQEESLGKLPMLERFLDQKIAGLAMAAMAAGATR